MSTLKVMQHKSKNGSDKSQIDTLRRPDFTQITAGDTVEAVSSNAGDTTQTLTIEARKADGTVVSETKTLNGTTAVDAVEAGAS